jgi:hypothetical protein
MSEVEQAESFKRFSGKPIFPPADFPLNRDGSDVRCIHAHNAMGLAGEFPDSGGVWKTLAVMAMSRNDHDKGIYTTFDVEECRAQAKAFNEMADYIEQENAKPRPEPQAESLEEIILKAGGASINLDDYMTPDPNQMNQVVWSLSHWAHKHGLNYDSLGHIPSFLHIDDERPAKEQIDANYQHGGGWREANTDGHWKLIPERKQLQGHPDDEPYNLIASCWVGDDQVHLYDSAWCAIVHADGSMSVARLD